MKLGQIEAGLHTLTEALDVEEQTGGRYSEAETYRLKGTLLLQQAVPDEAQAETYFQQALALARRQQAKSWELRTATGLARLRRLQEKRQDGYDLSAPMYAWFTEGFETADLLDAKALHDALAEGR